MKVFEALATLDESSTVAIMAISPGGGTRVFVKEDLKDSGMVIGAAFFAAGARWEVARRCEECSGKGRVFVHLGSNDPMAIDKDCPNCGGEKMIWEGA